VHSKEWLNIRVTSITISERRGTMTRRVCSSQKAKVGNNIWLIDGDPILNPISKALKTNFSKMNKISPANTK